MLTSTRLVKLSLFAIVALGVLLMWAFELFGTKFIPEGDITTGIEGGSVTLTFGGTTYPLYFEGGAGEALQKVIADDLTVIFGQFKEISFRRYGVTEEGVPITIVGGKYPSSYRSTDDDLNLDITHWFSFPGEKTSRPVAMRQEFSRVVTHDGQKYLLITKDLIKVYRSAWQQEQRYYVAYEKLEDLVASFNDLAQGRITVDGLPRSVPEMHYTKGWSDELIEELQSPESIQSFEKSFREIGGVRMPSILDVVDKKSFKKMFGDIRGITFPGELYAVLYHLDEDGTPRESNWPYVYVGGEWKIYIIESLLGAF